MGVGSLNAIIITIIITIIIVTITTVLLVYASVTPPANFILIRREKVFPKFPSYKCTQGMLLVRVLNFQTEQENYLNNGCLFPLQDKPPLTLAGNIPYSNIL